MRRCNRDAVLSSTAAVPFDRVIVLLAIKTGRAPAVRSENGLKEYMRNCSRYRKLGGILRRGRKWQSQGFLCISR